MGIDKDDESFRDIKKLLSHYDNYIDSLEQMRDKDT
jgi:hypothetical protein